MNRGPTSSPTCRFRKAPGRPRVHYSLREILLDAVFYMVRGGCAWRLLPHDDFPPWKKTVYHYLRAWRIDGTWERLHEALRRSRARVVRFEREPQPSAAIVDSQSVKTTGVGGAERGFELRGKKKVKGRKRHLLVDTQGLVMRRAKVHSAGVFDRDGIKLLMEPVRRRFPRLSHLCGWTPDTTARGRARTGSRRSWACRSRWSVRPGDG